MSLEASSVRANVAKLERNTKTRKLLTPAEKTKVSALAKAIADISAAEKAQKLAAAARRKEEEEARQKDAEAAAAAEAETAEQRRKRKKLARKLRKLSTRTTVPLPQDADAAKANMEAVLDSLKRIVPQEISGRAAKFDAALFAEAELQRITHVHKSAQVISKRDKEHNKRKLEQAHAALVEKERERWRVEARMAWIQAAYKQHKAEGKDPPTMEDALEAVTNEMAERAVTLERILGMEKQSQLTDKERRQEMRLRQEREAEYQKQEKERAAESFANMPEEVRKLHLAQQDKLARLQLKWNAMDVNHEQRRAQRVETFDQMIRQRSRLWHEHVTWLMKHGAPITDKKGNLVPKTDPDTNKPLIDPETNQMVMARHAPGQKVYIAFTVPPESFTEYAYEWLPTKDARVYTEQQAIAELEEHEAYADNPKLSAFDRAQIEEAGALLRNVVRDLADSDPLTTFVFKLIVQCDAIRPTFGRGHQLGPRMISAVSTCHFNEQADKKRLAARGLLKTFKKICAFCDGYILVADELLKTCGTCRESDKVAHKHQYFCCKPCKQSHVIKVHEKSQEAKRKRQRDLAKAAKQRKKAEQARRAAIRNARSDRRGDAQEEAMNVGVGYGFETPANFFEVEWPLAQEDDDDDELPLLIDASGEVEPPPPSDASADEARWDGPRSRPIKTPSTRN